MRICVRTLSTLLFVALLCACGSPSSDTSFKAPAGWTSTPAMFGRFQMWVTGNAQNNRQILMLVRGDQNLNAVEMNRLGDTRDVNDLQHRRITICGNQQADYFTGQGHSASDSARSRVRVEGLVTTVGSSKYMAMYVRPASMAPDTQAETALHSLCPR